VTDFFGFTGGVGFAASGRSMGRLNPDAGQPRGITAVGPGWDGLPACGYHSAGQQCLVFARDVGNA
jgi:hypothetical protein